MNVVFTIFAQCTTTGNECLRVTGHFCGNSPVTGEFAAQRPVMLMLHQIESKMKFCITGCLVTIHYSLQECRFWQCLISIQLRWCDAVSAEINLGVRPRGWIYRQMGTSEILFAVSVMTASRLLACPRQYMYILLGKQYILWYMHMILFCFVCWGYKTCP